MALGTLGFDFVTLELPLATCKAIEMVSHNTRQVITYNYYHPVCDLLDTDILFFNIKVVVNGNYYNVVEDSVSEF